MQKQTVILYAIFSLGITFLLWFVWVFLYQYIAAISLFREVSKAIMSHRILIALLLTVSSSTISTLISLIFGIPLAYFYATKYFKGKLILETVTIDIPQTFPPAAEGIILLLMLGPRSPFGINIAYTFSALVVAKIYICAPFIVAFTTRKFREIQETGLDIAAKTLGATKFDIFRTIYLPLSKKDILAAVSICWARAMGELGGSLVFAGVIPGKTEVIPTFIEENSKHIESALAATILVTTASALALIIFKTVIPGSNLWKAFFYRIYPQDMKIK